MKKEASKVKQTTRQSNTAHPRQSLVYVREMKKEGKKKQARSNKQQGKGNTTHVHVCICIGSNTVGDMR